MDTNCREMRDNLIKIIEINTHKDRERDRDREREKEKKRKMCVCKSEKERKWPMLYIFTQFLWNFLTKFVVFQWKTSQKWRKKRKNFEKNVWKYTTDKVWKRERKREI